MTEPTRLVVGLTGATGAIYGVRLLEALRDTPVETHLVISKWAQQNLLHETGRQLDQIRALADVCHAPADMGATLSSGSYAAAGMVVIPCSVASLGAVAAGAASHLVHRAADVTLKEQRMLVLVVRETPLSPIHLENMLKLSRLGVSIMPPVPAFYNQPKTIDDIIDHTVARVLDQFGIAAPFASAGTATSRTAKTALPASGVAHRRPRLLLRQRFAVLQ